MSAALANDDRLPHDRAVWRDYDAEIVPFDGAPAPGTGGRRISVDYGDCQIILTWGHTANWDGAKRWRFGWPPA